MASLGNHPNLNIAQCGAGGVGRRLPQSGMPLNWRADPLIAHIRKSITRNIANYLLAKGATPGLGVYGQQISQLSAEFESILFSSAVSKEDYLSQETFGERLSSLIQNKYYGMLPAQQRATYATPSVLPTFAAPPSQKHPKCNPSSHILNAVPDSIIAPSTPLNLGSADYFSGSQLSPDVMPNLIGSQENDFTRGSKRISQMTPALSDQVTSNVPFLVDGIPSIKCDDSNLTFSGSVLQYESEASFDSNSKTQYLIEDLPRTESQQCEQLEYGLKLHFNETSSGKRLSCHRFAQQNNAYVADPEFQEISGLNTTSYMYSQLSGGDDQISILSCYIKFKYDPNTSGLGQDPFLQYVHANMCNCACTCETLKSQLDHIDQCLSPHCRFCRPLLCYHNNDRSRSKGFNSRIHLEQTSFGNAALKNCSFVAPDLCHTPSKLRKLNSFTSKGAPFSSSHPISHELSPKQEQCSGPLLSSNSVDTELNMETDTPHTQYSASICDSKIDISGEEQRLSSENASPMSGDFVDCIQNEVEPAVNDEVKDKALENTSSPSSKCLTTLSEHQCTSQTNDAGTSNYLEGTQLDTTVEPLENTGATGTCSTSIKLKMQGVSLTEFFTPEEIKQHVWSLKQNIDQTVAEQDIGNTVNNCVSENFCQLCNLDKLWFPPMPIYCSPCGSRIKCRGTYYSMLDEYGGQVCFCSACFNKSRGANKSKMEMKKNDVVTEESWVQCDKCEGWQHQICALFNDKRDFGGKTEYICPNCYLAELETGDCKPLPWTSCFGASNLPRTILSDHLEQRLFERLEKDREDRVKAAGEDLDDQVLGASDLTVRVVSSVNKVLKVKQQFQDIFPDQSYPAEFPYRSKVILLFQKIEGVDVCLFGMYVQEFGSQCSRPNQRCIYISYLDSVKYFRPEAKSVAGEALRTFVYHEILIGYLEYCKKRGFSTCYIWACPPVKGEDYILYCHPEVQKTPKPDKLRQWYRSMLRKAAKEQIIVNSSNIYEQFFVPNEGCNTKVTAARLPYFDGDYWSSVADSMIKKIEKECGGDLQKKVKKMTRRSLKAMGHTDPTVTEGDAKDILLMHELGQTLSSAKEDFIIVYLQFICTHCHEVIASGKRWYCSHCKNFQLCEACHDEDHNPENTHISSSGQKHVLSQEVVDGVPSDTEDNDAIMNNCFLENRHALLSFCQGNHYQFDTLRRAKHSSMMILYHLHHPIGAKAETTCSLCLKDIAVDRQWKCNLCPDFIVCGACYQRNGVGCHTHNLSQNLSPADPAVEPEKVNLVKELLVVLLHASKCYTTTTSPCNYPNCLLIRKLFSHTRICKTRVAGGCPYCKKTWLVIKLHSLTCGDPNCCVPRCRDLRGISETKPPDTTPEVRNMRLRVGTPLKVEGTTQRLHKDKAALR
ncbi:hypothetical protein V2J09_023352 [Rumex salicifolius]